MARIIYGALATAIQGSIGGTTFQKNAYGYSIKNKNNVTRTNSINQNVQRRLLAYVSQGWSIITSAQRASWEAWALAHPISSIHNPSSVLKGYQYFLKYNLIHALFVSTYLAEPNPGSLAIPSISPIVSKSGGVLNLNINPATDESAIFCNIFMSPPVKDTHTFAKSNTRGIIIEPVIFNVVDISSYYLDQYGQLPTSGDTVFLELQPFGGSIPYIFASQYFTLTVS